MYRNSNAITSDTIDASPEAVGNDIVDAIEALEQCHALFLEEKRVLLTEASLLPVRVGLAAAHLYTSPPTAIFELLQKRDRRLLSTDETIQIHLIINQCIERINEAVVHYPELASFLEARCRIPFRVHAEGNLIDRTALWLDRVDLQS